MVAALSRTTKGSEPDDRGRLRDQIVEFDDERLERIHDFIQRSFDDTAIAAFLSRSELRAALRQSLDRCD